VVLAQDVAIARPQRAEGVLEGFGEPSIR